MYCMQDKHRPQFNWKDVDNAIVASTVKDGPRKAERLSATQRSDQGSLELTRSTNAKVVNSKGQVASKQGSAGREGSVGHESLTHDRQGNMPKGEKTGNAANALTKQGGADSADGAEGRRSSGVTGKSRAVERRRTSEGARRQRQSRAASRRASHSFGRTQEFQSNS